MSIFFNYNGHVYPEGTPVVGPDNRGLRYGDGIFETMHYSNGRIRLKAYHFERLFSSMWLLRFNTGTLNADFLETQVDELCRMNGHDSARIRLMVLRGEGGLYEPVIGPQYIIQSWALEHKPRPEGLLVDIYPGAKKNCDPLANIKSNNFLPYTMGALYARQHMLDDCILLNHHGRITDTTIANIFIIKDNEITTPLLSEGCIAGVMRRFVIETLRKEGYFIHEAEVETALLDAADEVFVTNALNPVRFVRQYRNRKYDNTVYSSIYNIIEEALKKKQGW